MPSRQLYGRRFGLATGGTYRELGFPEWTPLDLGSSALLWLRADRGITLNGATVSAWADQTGRGTSAVMASAANQPGFNVSSANFGGQPTLQFTRTSNKLLNCASGFTGFTGLTQATMFIAVRWEETTNSYCFSTHNAGSTSGTFAFQVSGTTAYSRSGTTGGGYVSSSGTPVASQVWETVYDASQPTDLTKLTLTRNGGLASSVASGAVQAAMGTVNGYVIGASTPTPTGAFSGEIAEILICNRALTASERAVVRRYMYARYALTGT